MFKKILVPLDGSPFSEQALPHALRIARANGGALRIVTVAAPEGIATARSSGGALEAPNRDRVLQGGRSYLEELGQRIAGNQEGVEVTTQALPSGNVVAGILRDLNEYPQDLVVMTSHGRGPVERAWLGSVADGLLRRAPSPTLLIRPESDKPAPPETDPEPFRHVMAPLDGSEPGSAALPFGTAMARADSARLTLLRVIPPAKGGAFPFLTGDAREWETASELAEATKEWLEETAGSLREEGLSVETHVRQLNHPAIAIVKAAEELNVDLLVMSTRGQGGVARLLMGSVADKVVRSSSIPVLVYRPPEGGGA